MEESEENLVPVEELDSTKAERIQERIVVLEKTLARRSCPAGEANILAAIAGYTSGRIECWGDWTLIYAGHVVDVCPDYASFTEDREERLDGYFQEFGPGWLWFEPPLAPREDAQPDQLLAATWAQPCARKSQLWKNRVPLCLEITMGFRRVQTFHSRYATTPQTPLQTKGGRLASMTPAEKQAKQARPTRGEKLDFKPKHTGLGLSELNRLHWAVKDDTEAPRCFFLMHLDSGASMLSLYDKDLRMLGIDPKLYPAQSQLTLSTANGWISVPLYEMRVDVCKHNGESLVGQRPVWPAERHELGGIFPVGVFPENQKAPPARDSGPLALSEVRQMRRRGEHVDEEALAKRPKDPDELRLSGLLPFQVCYTAGAPGMPLWFGEDRRDVLGTDRMPGQHRFECHKPPLQVPAPVRSQKLSRPTSIVFKHKTTTDQELTDQDVTGEVGRSLITLVDEDGVVEEHNIEPRKLQCQTLAKTRTRAQEVEDVQSEDTQSEEAQVKITKPRNPKHKASKPKPSESKATGQKATKEKEPAKAKGGSGSLRARFLGR